MIGLIMAQALAATAPAEGVISYPPAFFAAQQPGNASEMLSRIPGFTLDYGSGARGFEGTAGNVLIDGQRPVSKNDHLGAILSRIPVGRVERIDIIRGGAPGVDMQGKAILANVILRKDRAFRGQLEANGYGLADGRTLGGLEWQASGGAGDRSWETSGLFGRGYSDLLGQGAGLTVSPQGPPALTKITTEDDGHLQQLTGAYELPLAGGKLRVNGVIFRLNLKFEEDDAAVSSGRVESTDQLVRHNDREIGVTFHRPLAARTSLQLVGLYQNNALDLSSAFASPAGRQLFEIDRTTREAIARGVVKHGWTDALSGELGVEGAENRLTSRTGFQVDGLTVPVPAANVQVRERRAEAFAKASWRLSTTWTLDGQLRYERSTLTAAGDIALAKSLAFLKPRLLATWSPAPSTQVRLRLEREVDQLNFQAFVAQGNLSNATGITAGNPNLEPEQAWLAEAAFERRFWGRGALVVTATHSEVRGVVDRGPVFTPTGAFDRPANIGDGSRDMIKAELTLPLERFGLKGGQLKGFVTRRWSEVPDPTTLTPRPISGQQPVSWEVKFSQDLPARNATVGAELYGGFQSVYYRFNAVDAYKLEPYLIAYAEWKPRPDLNLRVELKNLTQRGYRHTTLTYPGPRNDGRAPTLRDQDFHFGRILYIRLRKSFGG